MRKHHVSWALVVLSSSALAETAPTYEVHCEPGATAAAQCRVDQQTYVGWRTYHSSCNHCHGQDGLGGSFAPSLVSGNTAVNDYESFVRVTEEGVQGSLGVMPGFKDNPNIGDKLGALYSYLKARSDGKLPGGRPVR